MALLFTLVFSFSFAGASDSTSKVEVELKVNLTKSGFKKIKSLFEKNFGADESERSDYYFDIFKQPTGYYLKSALPPIKLRFMWDGDDLTWQVQRTLSTEALGMFVAKKTDSASMDIKHDNALFDLINNYHSTLDNVDPYALTLAAQIQKSLKDNEVISFTQTYCSQCVKGDKYFSTHMNTKTRTKIKLKLEDDQFSIQVGETNNRGVVSYELEAEIKKSNNIRKSAELLQNWLTSQGFTKEYIDTTVATDPTTISEENLKKLYSL